MSPTAIVRAGHQRGGVALMLSVFLPYAGPAAAQFVSTASIEGVVHDESGAALPGITVTLMGDIRIGTSH